jgi:hypothetical protein
MQRALSCQKRRGLSTVLLLVAFVVRAFVPEGFMPAHTAPLSVEICPEGFPPELLHGAHHHHGAGHGHFEHCVFGCAGPAAPAPHLAVPPVLMAAPAAPPLPLCRAPTGIRLVHLPQARGPPTHV